MAVTVKATARERLEDKRLAALVSGAAAGDESSWAALVSEFDGLLWAIARGHRLRDSDAADVVQITWTKVLEHLSRLNDPTRVGGWLATTARRECLSVLRRLKRDVPYGDELPECESPRPTPEEALSILERDQALWRSFSRLRSSDQALLRLLLAEPRPSYEDISAALEMPIGSIGPTRARALERLRRELARESEFTTIDNM